MNELFKKKVLRLQRLVYVFASVRLTSPGAGGNTLLASVSIRALQQGTALPPWEGWRGEQFPTHWCLHPAGACVHRCMQKLWLLTSPGEDSLDTLSSDLLGPLAGALPDMPEGKASHTSSSHTPLPEKAVPASRVSFGISGLSGNPGLQACMRPCLDSTACVPLTGQGCLILF